MPTNDPLIPNYQYIFLPHASRIHIASLRYEKFIRADNEIGGRNSLVLSENIPWKHGASFEIYRPKHDDFEG